MERHRAEFDEACRWLRPRIERYLRKRAGDSDAADLTQQVFLKAKKALPGFRGDATWTTWIFRIASNVARDHLRSTRRAQLSDLSAADLEAREVEHTLYLADTRPDQAFLRREMRSCIREKCEEVPENYRSVLLLSEIEDLSDEAISKELGLNLSTVKIRLHRARSRLRQSLQCGCSFYRDDANGLMCDRKSHG